MAPRGRALLLPLLLVLAYIAGPSRQQGVQLPCTTDGDCDTAGASCVAGVCSCPKGQVMTSDLTTCLAGASEWGASCTDAVQCVSRLLVGGSCAAKEVITSTSTSTTTTAVPPTTAEPPVEERVCRCAQGYHYLRGQCWRSVGLGGACTRSETCFANHDSESVACVGGKCACATGFYQREYSSCRRISTAFGQECGIGADCQYADSACVSRKCACREGYSYDKDAKKCAPSKGTTVQGGARAGGQHERWRWSRRAQQLQAARTASDNVSATADNAAACTADSDCGDNGDCVSGACVCQRGYYKSGTRCYPELQQVCSGDGACRMKNAVCRETGASGASKMCSCSGGYIPSEDMRLCRKMTPELLTWSCLHDEQCGYFGPSAACVEKRCHCGAGTHWAADKQYCWVSKAVGEACSAAEDCAGLSPGGGAACTDAVCTCTTGYHASADRSACRADADHVDAACADDLDCTADHTVCADKKCACSKGFVPLASGKGCGPGVGGPCAKDGDCLAKDSSCDTSSKTCSCGDGMVSSAVGDACLKEAAHLNDTCTEVAQCRARAADCVEGRCVCSKDTFYRDGQCRAKRALGASCRLTSECYLDEQPERAECRNGVCKCGFAYEIPGYPEACAAGEGRAAGAAAVVSLAAGLVLLLASR